MGTENRAPPEEFIPPQERPYDYIVFRAAEVANLALDVDPRPEPRIAFNDPAVISVSVSTIPMDASASFCLPLHFGCKGNSSRLPENAYNVDINSLLIPVLYLVHLVGVCPLCTDMLDTSPRPNL